MNRNEFIHQYHEKHKLCPMCGSPNHTSTCVGYAVDMTNMESYRDENECVCNDCGNVHVIHDRVSNIQE